MNKCFGITWRRLARPVPVAALLVLAVLGEARADEQTLQTARDDYDIGHYQRAFDRFAALADREDCEAARIAREMVRHGPGLYARRFEVRAERLARWHAVPRCEAGRLARVTVATP